MRKSFFLNLMSAGILLAVMGCKDSASDAPIPAVTISESSSKIILDGKLTEEAWSHAHGYQLVFHPPAALPREAAVFSKDPYETAEFKLLYDKEYLYVGCILEDSDIINTSKKNQSLLLLRGDLFEFFIAPAETKPVCYWEFYAAPNGLRTSYFYPSRGLVGMNTWLEEDEKNLVPNFAVKVNIDGTVNNITDTDHGWTVEMRIPLAELEEKSGIKFAPTSKWRVQAARYNFGKQLNRVQNSTFPSLPRVDFHLVEYYSPVEFQ